MIKYGLKKNNYPPNPMPATPTYSPLTPQNPAAQFGIMNSTFRITSPHTDVPQPTANYSLLTAHWTFTFSAKERDSETGLSYFGSRYYSSDLSIWLSVDPQSDKYASLSPYVYCADNPVKMVDPNGEDIWEINENGEIVNHYELTEKDVFYIIDKDGNRIKDLTFDSKVVEQSKSQFSGKDKRVFDWYIIRGDKNATILFEFLSNNTTVEWGQLFLGQTGDNGLNIITTSHDVDRNRTTTFLLENKYKFGYTIRGCNHNHPNNMPYPSGLFTDNTDIAFARYLTAIAKNNGCKAPFFKIYTPCDGKYIKFNQNSKRSDFPLLALPEINVPIQIKP